MTVRIGFSNPQIIDALPSRHVTTGQDKTGQIRPRHDRIGQNKTGQVKTCQDQTE